MKLTSVIIPACNEELYIRKTIESYLKQEFKKEKIPYELIVVANGCESNDDTLNIAEDLGAKVIELEEGNVSIARNTGAAKSEGEILIFNDADTIVAPNYVEKVYTTIDEKNLDYGTARAKADRFTPSALTYALMLNFGGLVLKVACGNMFVKRNQFESVNGFAEELKNGEDTDLNIKLRKNRAKYCFLWGTSFKTSSRDISFRRILADSWAYVKLKK